MQPSITGVMGLIIYRYDQLNVLFKLSDSVVFFNEHAQQVREILPKLSAAAQGILLEFIAQHSDLLQQQTELIIMLALSSSKTVREQATIIHAQLNQTESQQYLQHFLC